jgi:hypothetical protein
MADNKLLSQMLEHLVNEDSAKAEELFHEYVVAKSREIYENLIETEISEEEKDEDEDEEMDEAAKDEDAEDDKVDEASDEDKDDEKMDEEFEDIAIEADDEMGGDPTDDLESELNAEEDGEEEAEKGEEELFQDLEAIVDELQAKFDELKGEEGEHEMGGEEEPKMDAFEPELETVREYVEKVPAGHGAEKKGAAEKADNTKSTIDNMKNDMGGTTANILSGKNGTPGSETGELKGSGLLKGKPTEDNAGNINVPGGKAGNAFSKKEPGHGAEKAGAKESPDNKQSLFRGRR